MTMRPMGFRRGNRMEIIPVSHLHKSQASNLLRFPDKIGSRIIVVSSQEDYQRFVDQILATPANDSQNPD